MQLSKNMCVHVSTVLSALLGKLQSRARAFLCHTHIYAIIMDGTEARMRSGHNVRTRTTTNKLVLGMYKFICA